VRDIDDIIDQLERIAKDLARAAQNVYDDWDQVDGYSDAYGTGGICDDIAAEMASVIIRKLRLDAYPQYNEYDTHTSVFVQVDDIQALIKVDIHPSYYEVGYGYTWQKIPDVRFSSQMVSIEDFSDVYDEYA
jgi:hypothetical protein